MVELPRSLRWLFRVVAVGYVFMLVLWPVSLVVRETFRNGLSAMRDTLAERDVHRVRLPIAHVGERGAAARGVGAHLRGLGLIERARAVHTHGGDVGTEAHPHLDAALTSLTVVAERSQRLSPNGLVPQLADAVGQVQKLLEPIQPLVSRSQAFLDLERYFFSTVFASFLRSLISSLSAGLTLKRFFSASFTSSSASRTRFAISNSTARLLCASPILGFAATAAR